MGPVHLYLLYLFILSVVGLCHAVVVVSVVRSAAGVTQRLCCRRYACQPREVVLDCGPYRDRSGLSSSLHSELNQALHFLNDCNLAGLRADRDPTFISKQVGRQGAGLWAHLWFAVETSNIDQQISSRQAAHGHRSFLDRWMESHRWMDG